MRSVIERFKKNTRNNKGMALVTVIVAIGFIAALVSILLMTTLVNFKMKVVNERGKDTFYSAEQVLDEITVGLQRRVSDSLSASYKYILENYGDYDNATKSQLIQQDYYSRLWNYLEVSGSAHQNYDVTKLEDYLKESTKWHLYSTYSGESGEGDGYGAIITAVDPDTGLESKEGAMFTYTGGGIVLKNIKVYYKDVYGFVSVIQTDIRLNYPGFEFAKNSALADITNYCFVADGGITRSGAGGDLNIDGNVYANNFVTRGNVKTTLAENSLLIVKHDIDVKDGGFEGKEGTEIWAKNIIATSSNININGSVNLSNDLNLKGNSPSTKIKGVYNGYGNSLVDPEYSSAILINGKASTVDFSGVKNMKLYGRAYLGMTSTKDMSEQFQEGDVIAEPYKDVITGESIAVKSDQLMYLVPGEAIGVDVKTGRSLYGKNPLTKKEYDELVGKVAYSTANPTSSEQWVMISDDTPISVLDGAKLMDYVQYDETGLKPKVYTHQIRVNDTAADNGLVYFYMLFGEKEVTNANGSTSIISAEQVGNDYFNVYYNHNKDMAERYANIYIDKVLLPNLSSSNVTRAGQSYVTTYDDGAKGLNIWSETQMGVGNVKAEDASKNHETFRAYTSKLIPNVSELGSLNKNDTAVDKNVIDDPNGQIVFENIVSKKDKLLEYIDRADDKGCNGQKYGDVTVAIAGTGDSKEITFTDDSGDIAIVSTRDVTVNSGDIHLVITTGNVNVTTTNFSGVILCDKKVTLNGTSVQTCAKEPDKVVKCLQFGYEADGLTYAVASCLEGGNDYVYASYGDGYSGANALEGLVTYENWKKE